MSYGKHSLWTEKYRPKTLNDVIGQKSTEVFKGFARNKNIVDCCLTGPAGVGKTTSVIALCIELYGSIEKMKENLLILDASDERGIDVVRNKISDHAGEVCTVDEVGFKVIFLDEADNLTLDAQQALRRTIEDNTETCRFILACNYENKLIEPLKSRGPPIPFFRLNDDDMKTILLKILDGEKITMDDDAIDHLIQAVKGDLRALTNRLQIACLIDKKITLETLKTFLPRSDHLKAKSIIEYCLKSEIPIARSLLIEMYTDCHYDSNIIIRSFIESMDLLEDQIPNELIRTSIEAKIGKASIDCSLSHEPLFVLIALINDIHLISKIPPTCSYVGGTD